jgi:hypothetical protein
MRLAAFVPTGLLVTIVLVLALAALPSSALAQGCAMCQTALDGPPDPLTQAFNVSSLFLMATPYTVVAGIGGWIYFAGRRRREPLVEDGAPDDFE